MEKVLSKCILALDVVHRVVLWKKLVPWGPYIIWFWCNPFFFPVLMCLWLCLQWYDRGAAGNASCYYVPTPWSENCRRGLEVGTVRVGSKFGVVRSSLPTTIIHFMIDFSDICRSVFCTEFLEQICSPENS